jgi:predicted nucleic acid-binding protein
VIYYLDTSALVKAYVQEDRSQEVRDLLHQSRAAEASWLYVSRLTYPETLSAITRRENRGEIAPGDARLLHSRVSADFTGPDRLYQIIEPTAAVVNDAAGIVIRHRLRGFDAVQLAGALLIFTEAGGACTLVASDRQLLAAAAAEGISILDLSTSL